MRGPFSRADPDGSEGASVHEDLKSYFIPGWPGWNQYEIGIVAIDSTTGEPKDIVHFGGRGHDGVWDVRASSDVTRLAASGYFSGNLTFTGLPTILSTNSEATGTMDDSVAMDGFVVALDSDLAPIWAKRWPESAVGASPWGVGQGSRCLGVEFDSSNNVYGIGYRAWGADYVNVYGVISKMASADGAQIWEKVFTDVQHFERATISNDGSGDFFVRGKSLTTTGVATAANPTPFGVSCAADSCGVVARMTSDGALVWARTIEGADYSIRYFSGEIGLDATGAPYIYLTMKDAAKSGPVSLALLHTRGIFVQPTPGRVRVPVLRSSQGQECVVRRRRLHGFSGQEPAGRLPPRKSVRHRV